jgi:hypothetical protein
VVDYIEKKQDHTLTPLDAVRCVEEVCIRFMDKTVCICFVTWESHEEYSKMMSLRRKEGRKEGGGGGYGGDGDEEDLPLSKWVWKVGCGILGQYDCDAYEAPDDDITYKTQTDKEIVREMRSESGKKAEELAERDGEEKEEENFEVCHFPL